ncbi:MAG: rhodanese-like domain-containing protein [Saprospiraceae bacterium]
MFSFFKKLLGPSVNFKELVGQGALIVDVRTPEEYKQGHIDGSMNIPLQVLPGKIADLRKKGKTIITVCRSGARSGAAVGMLKKAGLEAFNGGPWNSLKNQI